MSAGPEVGDVPEHVRENRSYWDGMAAEWVAPGERLWAAREPNWGIWGTPEAELAMLPADMTGLDAIELGCGTAYVSAWMARRGAHVYGIDNSAKQLETAHRLAREHGVALDLAHGNAETVPKPAGSFDFAISEYGAAIWCDPKKWIPEAHRLLRPGGRLVFLGHSPWSQVCAPENGDITQLTLQRSYFDLGRIDWSDVEIEPGGIEFNLPISGWWRLFDEVGFDVDDFREVRAPAGAAEERYFTTRAWAHDYPCEQVWKLRKRA